LLKYSGIKNQKEKEKEQTFVGATSEIINCNLNLRRKIKKLNVKKKTK
jgi:hypothetical protein